MRSHSKIKCEKHKQERESFDGRREFRKGSRESVVVQRAFTFQACQFSFSKGFGEEIK